MSRPHVSLVTCKEHPELTPDDQPLIAALEARGMDVRVEIWDDPTVDWQEAGICVLRCVQDYASRRKEFLKWTDQVPRLLNQADIIKWNSDKHYLIEMARRGLPTIPTVWLEPEDNLTKHQLHTRFPSHGDFVVKPAISSAGRDMGRFTSTDAYSRMEAIRHAMQLLEQGRSVMVQRYLQEVSISGEFSLIYVNGLVSHYVEKMPLLESSTPTTHSLNYDVVSARTASEEEWRWGERIRVALHSYIKDRLGHDQQLLFKRVDLVRGGDDGFYIMEISLVDGSLYLQSTPGALDNFADAIAQRAFW